MKEKESLHYSEKQKVVKSHLTFLKSPHFTIRWINLLLHAVECEHETPRSSNGSRFSFPVIYEENKTKGFCAASTDT